MEELQISVKLNEGTITTNADELKEQLSLKMAEYDGALFTEDSKKFAKQELAKLRKLKDAVDQRRKDVKNQWMIPYKDFEAETKELISIIDKPIQLIDSQLKEIEEVRIQKKRAEIKELYDEVVAEASEYLPLDEIYDKKWDNSGTSMKKIREDLEALVTKTANDIAIIQNSMSDVKDEALHLYRKDRNLADALKYINTYEANRKRALEIEREKREQEEVRRREEEIARVRAEERAHMKELERAKADNVSDKMTEEFVVPEIDDSALPFTQPTTITAFYRVVATPEELEQVEMAFNSIGIYFERKDV